MQSKTALPKGTLPVAEQVTGQAELARRHTASRWLMWGAIAFTVSAFLPILALNWGANITRDWSVQDPVEWAVVVAWTATAAVAFAGSRGQQRGWWGRGRATATRGPQFAPRKKRRAAS